MLLGKRGSPIPPFFFSQGQKGGVPLLLGPKKAKRPPVPFWAMRPLP